MTHRMMPNVSCGASAGIFLRRPELFLVAIVRHHAVGSPQHRTVATRDFPRSQNRPAPSAPLQDSVGPTFWASTIAQVVAAAHRRRAGRGAAGGAVRTPLSASGDAGS
jgi:hypothetical protein